jgi:phenylalanyl-tRNA synthetase alpha chain
VTRDQLREIETKKNHGDAKVLADLRKRKLVAPQKVISYRIEKGPKFAREFVREATDLTAEMIAK